MADRTSAEIFGAFFEKAAEMQPTDDLAKLVDFMWGKSKGYDFNEYQMYCDDALIKLGLAYKGVDRRFPEDGETVLYR